MFVWDIEGTSIKLIVVIRVLRLVLVHTNERGFTIDKIRYQQ